MIKRAARYTLISVLLFLVATAASLRAPGDDFKNYRASVKKFQVVDRAQKPLNITYDNDWNYNDSVPLHQVPEFLQNAFIYSEDRNFMQHGGVDWEARMAAIYQNIKARRTVRGASTISEQVIRMLHPRSRNIWSRWLEGFEAGMLELQYNKHDILEFYLNQVPYTAKRRGVAQAARYYFNRELGTLSKKEMLGLAVLPRSPSRLDLYKNPQAIEPAITRLAQDLKKAGLLNENDIDQIKSEAFELQAAPQPVEASHFVNYISRQKGFNTDNGQKITTTLDSSTQQMVQKIIDQRLESLKSKTAGNAAALVVDNKTGEIISWVVGRAKDNKNEYRKIDTVTSPRQPGSSLKPFLYTLALDSGWNAATIIDDSPYSEAIGSGLHKFNNYSNSFYGKITLREALGNSLNIPALHTIRFVGLEKYYAYLQKLGFKSLDKEPEFYNEGLALGNGEVTLFELVRAYASLANKGKFMPLKTIATLPADEKQEQIFTPEAASLIANILSDPWARRLEFGQSSVLNLPVQTAIKTGTSTDYRDAWAVGFNSNYTVGIWIGNLDHRPMASVTGSTGPALALRSIFSELNKNHETQRLYLSPKLALKDICVETDVSKSADGGCIKRSEYFLPETEIAAPKEEVEKFGILRPSNNLHMAIDPRIPLNLQAFEFATSKADKVVWILNGREIATTDNNKYMWQLARGKHKLQANITSDGKTSVSEPVNFVVK